MSGPRVVRFDRATRLLHWVQAVPYLVLLATGALLLAQRVGGRELVPAATLARIHEVASVALVVGVVHVLVAWSSRATWRDLSEAFRWGPKDLAWFVLEPLHAVCPRVRRPACGKLNPGQKLNLLAQLALVPTLAVSGAAMWYRGGAIVAWWIHVGAFAVSVPLIAGHLYLALIHRSTRPALRGMVDGTVDAAWARAHHPRWDGPRANPPKASIPDSRPRDGSV